MNAVDVNNSRGDGLQDVSAKGAGRRRCQDQGSAPPHPHHPHVQFWLCRDLIKYEVIAQKRVPSFFLSAQSVLC